MRRPCSLRCLAAHSGVSLNGAVVASNVSVFECCAFTGITESAMNVLAMKAVDVTLKRRAFVKAIN